MIKSIPADLPVTFSPLTPSSQDLPDQMLAREAKTANNNEKGYQADEKYLGEQQNLDARVRQIERNSYLPIFDDDIPF